ncbi:MAG TPA: hypothetical protein VMB34_06835 [Acetobacteraceae bacterium]|nr:hypothetical protein [Acetobacteraceae bacterium]
MLYKWRRRLKTWNFDRQIAAVMDTPPLRIVDADCAIVSMVRNRDVPMYLLCIKAFYRHLGAGRVVGIIDRDMPRTLRDTIRRHVDGIEFVILEDLDPGRCQRGGTWERLVFLLDGSASRYMIQMDADILAVGPDLAEVGDCVARNVAFTIADGDRFRTMREAARIAQAEPDDPYVGTAIEQCFDRYPDCDRLRYVRGSSGLAGFARGGFARTKIEEFHAIMQGLLPDRWHEWGSEQCGSNFAVANSPGAVALPYPAYGSFGEITPRERCKCFHFIGAYRFMDGYFARRGREIIRQLAAA